MSSSVATTSRVTEGQKVSADYLPLIGATPPQASVGKPVTAVDLCAELAAAIDATGQRKEAALAMEISGPVLTKQLGRVENAAPRLDRCSALKRETLIAFAHRILQACDVGDPEIERRTRVEEAARALGQLVAMVLDK